MVGTMIRKSYATMLIDSKLSAKAIQTQMGHADISTTMRYYYQDISNTNDGQKELKKVKAFSKLA